MSKNASKHQGFLTRCMIGFLAMSLLTSTYWVLIGAHAMVTAQTPSATPVIVNPFRDATWFIDPASAAKLQADAWRAFRPEDAAQMDKISQQPTADWFDKDSGDIGAAITQRLDTISESGGLPVFVAYNIPMRDCQKGGAGSAEEYQAWIRGFASALGDHKVVIILEPDALAQLPCLSPEDQAERIALIKDAVTVLKAQPNTFVYVDAGHAHWTVATEMAELLTAAGIQDADGFALNVSSFGTTEDNAAFGHDLSSRIGGKHFVIDTSRNGLGPTPDFAWCNPPGRALGHRPSGVTEDPLIDAYLWIKYPGESDGTCNGGPVAGEWWPEYALGLAQRAAY